MDRVILHCDLNNFYASVECLERPELRGRPVAVCGDESLRHGIVLAKNNMAKKAGIKTGEPLHSARRKCPSLTVVPACFDKYLAFSRRAREIYARRAFRIESFGIDECWLDITGCDDPVACANEIRADIRNELGITASVGVSWNKIFAKLASDLKKPDATTHITRSNYKRIIWPLDAAALLYVGPATRKRLASAAIFTIGDIAAAPPGFLSGLLGKWGLTLSSYANGLDRSPVLPSDVSPDIKSIGNSTTTPHDLISESDVKQTFFLLSESVAERMRKHGLKGKTLQISIKYNDLNSCERQSTLPYHTCVSGEIAAAALRLYKLHSSGLPVRALGVRLSDLISPYAEQLSWLSGGGRKEELERTIDSLRGRFGHFCIQRALMLSVPQPFCPPVAEASPNSIAFMR
ncbi:MAG: DNA polymerase Y family protein [Christensenellales bacterium]|jgi:DNA polymerase-4